jgi:hypothetical protein
MGRLGTGSGTWRTRVTGASGQLVRSTGLFQIHFGATVTARKTNYDFERRERERSKAADSAKKAQAKADKRALEQGTPDTAEIDSR